MKSKGQYCSYCGKYVKDKDIGENYDSWFNLMWCCEEHKVAPTSPLNIYNTSTGKLR